MRSATINRKSYFGDENLVDVMTVRQNIMYNCVFPHFFPFFIRKTETRA